MVRRHEGTAFMGGAHVFPGGRVDAADRDADDSWCDGIAHARRASSTACRAADAVAYHVAAARELFEEAGVLLAQASGRRLRVARRRRGSRAAQAGSHRACTTAPRRCAR